MRAVIQLVGALTFLAGVGMLLHAAYLPTTYVLRGASAVQISQVYDTAGYYAALATAVFAATLVLALAGQRK